MKKSVTIWSVWLLPLIFITIFNLFAVQADTGLSRIDPYLLNLLNSTDETELVPVYIMLEERLSLEYLQSQTAGLNKKERRSVVVRLLKEHAAKTQKNIMSFLEASHSRGDIGPINNIWAINVIAFSSKPSVIYDLAKNQPEIENFFYDPVYPIESLIDDNGITKHNRENNLYFSRGIMTPQPGLTLINAIFVFLKFYKLDLLTLLQLNNSDFFIS